MPRKILIGLVVFGAFIFVVWTNRIEEIGPARKGVGGGGT